MGNKEIGSEIPAIPRFFSFWKPCEFEKLIIIDQSQRIPLDMFCLLPAGTGYLIIRYY